MTEQFERAEFDAVEPTLSAADRCDVCGAPACVQAIVRVDDDGRVSDLLFCGAHWSHHRAAAATSGLAYRGDRQDGGFWPARLSEPT